MMVYNYFRITVFGIIIFFGLKFLPSCIKWFLNSERANSNRVISSLPQKRETPDSSFASAIPVSKWAAKSSARVGQPLWFAVTCRVFPASSWACSLV